MALPVTITTGPQRLATVGSHNRPFRSSEGNIYVVMMEAGTAATAQNVVQDGDMLHVVGQKQPSTGQDISPTVYKATDPTSSFSNVGTGSEPTWQTDGGDSELWYSRFDMSADAWVDVDTSDPDILVDDVQDSEGVYAVGITLRSDGDIIIIYQGHRDKFMGVDRPRVAAAVNTTNGTAAGWTADLDVSTIGNADDKYVGAIVMPPNNSDQAHIFYNNDTATFEFIHQRAMQSNNTMRTNRDTAVSIQINNHQIRSAMAFTRGGSDFVKVHFADIASDPSVYEMAPFSDDSDPTGTDSVDEITTENVQFTNGTAQMDFAFDPGTETIHSLHVDASGDDIQHHDDQGTDTWQDNGTVVTGTITGGGPYCNIYDRDGAKIGYVYEDSSSNVIYNEIDITPSTTALSEVDMGQQNSYHGPFEVGSDHYTICTAGNGHDIVAVKATPASPVDGDWNSVDTPVRVFADKLTQSFGVGWEFQDPIESIWVFEDSSDLHVATQQESGRVAYHVFDPGTDAWTIRDELAANTGDTNFGVQAPANPATSLGLRADGDVVFCAAYAGGGGEETIRCFTRESGSWTNQGDASQQSGGELDFGIVVTGPDSSDRISFIGLSSQSTVGVRSISSTNSLSGYTTIDSGVDTADLLVGPGVIDSSNVIYVPYIDADNQISVANFTSADTPTPSVDDTVGDNTVYGHGRTTAPFVAACLAITGTDVHLVYSDDTDKDLQHDSDVDGGGTTDVELVAGAGDIARVSCNIYSTALHYIYDDAGTTKYGTLSLIDVVPELTMATRIPT